MVKCVGVIESPKGSNKGDSVTKWLKLVGINYAAPWCGVFTGIKSVEGVSEPSFISGRAKSYAISGYAYQLSDVIYGNYTIKAGDWRVKSRKGGGHVDTFISWDNEKQEGYVIGGNVNDQVSIRKVTLRSMIADQTTHIVDIKGFYNY